MATTSVHGSGSQSPTSLSRTIEKVFDESQYTGEINLSGRKLKEYPKCACKYDLVDTTSADLSRNRFSEVPADICNCGSLERLNCYHNVIKSLPVAIVQLQNLVYLNLSRNQLCVIPAFISRLELLQVLLVNNNRLVSLPEEIGRLGQLMQLDVSCNEITQLPDKIGDAESLQSLDVRKNLLVELPISICRLRLRHLDFSCNRIAHIPCDIRRVETLERLSLGNNPLLSPPAAICTRGLVHIMKFLNAQAARNETKRDVLRTDFNVLGTVKRSQSCMPSVNADEVSLSGLATQTIQPISSLSLVSSGYGTSAGSEKSRWSHTDTNADEVSRGSLILRAAETVKEQRQGHRDSVVSTNDSVRNALPLTSNNSDVAGDEITKELQRQKADYNARRRRAEQLRLTIEQSDTADRRSDLQQSSCQQQNQTNDSRHTNSAHDSRHTTACRSQSAMDMPHSHSSSEIEWPSAHTSNKRRASSDLSTNINGVLTNKDGTSSSSVYGSSATTDRLQSSRETGVTNSVQLPVRHCQTLPRRFSTTSVTGSGLPLEEEFRRRREAMVAQQRREAVNVLRRLDEMRRSQPRPTNGDIAEAGLSPHSNNSSIATQSESAPSAATNSTKSCLPTGCRKALEAMSAELNGVDPSFTMRRNIQHALDDRVMVDELRKVIETIVKIKLPEDMHGALRDGVLLCHLSNHLRPHSVSTVHVPSPSVPKLTLAKCRRNVENFLLACRRVGVSPSEICSVSAILEQREEGLVQIARTVRALVEAAARPKQSAV